ncbi:alpha-L-arabinofuranosidase C-terminal domain-containing protein [Danxiaibacter flavus]|uniref:non-reducing end alpha-L-arabinofuranosidase n=1 Tax=Danxiaibacter flavus TaxID=3049108 RepID=A0ABV3ZED9_9BACT|nr:alpha-L-arabinofuranosidase C-terminal domain-containing protein [Chitinophagaceae bacterium DXS]
MKKVIFLVALLAVVSAQSQTLKARIKIDTERKNGSIDSLLYGNFTEHLGRCIYGGIYDPKSSMANMDGFRKDVIDATKKMGVSIVRWPGGNFVSGYHWMDGIGAKEQRPKRKDLAWGDIETNQVGTDEFMQFAKAANVAPYVCVNMGTGTLDEARNWVEYCNAPTGLYYSDLRAKNGHPEPYNVKYWGLGNEVDGEWQMGHMNAEDYSKKALEAAKLMKWSDNSIKLIASGSSNYGSDWMNWNRTVLTSLRDQIDYISLHHYSGNYDKDHYKFMAITSRVDNIIDITKGMIKEVKTRYRVQRPIYIAFDEYNVWYRAHGEQKLEEHYNMQDALVVAMYLNCFIRHADIVKMANLAQLVNVIAPMMITNDKLWMQTTYYPLQLFSENCHGESLQPFVECDTYDAGDFKQVPYLDVSSVYNEKTKELLINVVNRHKDKAIETNIANQFGQLGTKAVVYEVNSSDINDENTVNEQKVKTTEKEININGAGFVYNFPAHSFTMLKIKMK